MNTKEVIAQLRKERRAREWTQDCVGVTIGISQNHIARCETGRHSPSFDLLASWADALDYELVLRPKGKP